MLGLDRLTPPAITTKLHVSDGHIIAKRTDDSDAGNRVSFTSQNNAGSYVAMEMAGSTETGSLFGFSLANLGWVRAANVSALVVGTNVGDVIFAPGGTEKARVTTAGDMELSGFVKLATIGNTVPSALDCDTATKYGRMKVDEVNALLYICTAGGWVAK